MDETLGLSARGLVDVHAGVMEKDADREMRAVRDLPPNVHDGMRLDPGSPRKGWNVETNPKAAWSFR